MQDAAESKGNARMAFAFLLGDAGISGGTNVILEHALAMRAVGHRVTLVTPRPVADRDLAWKPGAANLARGTAAGLRGQRFDLALATWWRSAYDLAELEAEACAYFVQSIESRFFANEHPRRQALARASYELPLPVITEALWIADHLRARLGRDVSVVRNGVDKQVFSAAGSQVAPPLPRGLRVLVEGPLGVAYKRVELAVRLCQRAGVDEIWLLTATDCSDYPGVDRVFSRLPPAQVGEVMRACDVLVKLSTVEGMFGPPLEMMHCGGTAVTSDVSGHEEFMRHGDNGIVVPRGEELAVVEHLRRLSRERDRLGSLRAAALRTASDWPSWQQATDRMRTELERLASDGSAPTSASLRHAIERAARAEPTTGRGLWPLLRRHARAFTRTRLPALAAQFDRDERSPQSRHRVEPMPHLDPPRFVRPRRRLRIWIVDDGDPFADHMPATAADFEVVRQPLSKPPAADVALAFAPEVARLVAAIPDGPFTVLLALEEARRLRLPLHADCILVADLLDGIDLRLLGLPVAGTWLPPVHDDFFLANSSSAAWHSRSRDAVFLVDEPRRDGKRHRSLPLTADADTLRHVFAETRVVSLPRQSRTPRLAAARALLAMASGCLVVSPPLALDYGALAGEHFVPSPGVANLRGEIDSVDLDVVRMCGRALAARHAATARLQRLVADISTRERAIPGRMLANRRSP